MSFSIAGIERRKTRRMLVLEKMEKRLTEHRIQKHGVAFFFYPDCKTCKRMEKEILHRQKLRRQGAIL